MKWPRPLISGCPEEPQKFIEISMSVQYPKKSPNWCPKVPKGDQNEVQINTQNDQIQTKVKHMKSYVFEKLGHQNSTYFLFKIHQEIHLQSKYAF